MAFLQDLNARGLVHDASEGVEEALAGPAPLTGYVGFDPTADSLHVGHLVPIMGLVRLQRAGHRPVALVGGGTGLIGDPSGKSAERTLLSEDQVRHNAEGIRRQLEPFLDFGAVSNAALLENNLDWLGSIRMVEFLRDVGKHFSVNVLLKKDAVRRRLENEETGISYTEFSYVLLQAYDFLELQRRTGCTLQMGGSDQWGNIIAGIDLIRRVSGVRAHGITFPLITTASGVKFGKTEHGTVWLDPARTSPFRFYQFWLSVEDADVLRYLRYFTLIPGEEIGGLADALASHPERREAQRALAETMTRQVHGDSGVARARQATEVLFGGGIEGLSAAEIGEIFADVPSSEVTGAELEGAGLPLVELLVRTGLVPSRGEARRAVEGGGVYLNNARMQDFGRAVRSADAVAGAFLVLRRGKKQYHLVRVLR